MTSQTRVFEPEEDGGVVRYRPRGGPRRTWRNWLIGTPLSTADAPHQTIGKVVGLAVFASDALSSTAYATQEMLVILAVAGTMAFGYAMPIALGIVALLAIVTVSYEQTIHAYPGGGGAYIVARDNLGELAAQAAGAALLTDYVLTVAVSVSSGVAQMASALPALMPYRAPIAVALVVGIMVVNMRGVQESGRAFAAPTYAFVALMVLTLVVALVQYARGSLGVVVDPPEIVHRGALGAVTTFLLLRAFASGTSALTGVEAISNGITAFREPRSYNAGVTLVWMSTILATLFLGLTFVALQVGAVPSEAETVVSQVARTAFGGRGVAYIAVMAATTAILILAANTAFAGFPRLSALIAADGFLPRQLMFRGSRLVFSRGIALLALVACLLILAFNASVSALIPLYAIGVFLSFTLSQAGMAHRWWKSGHLAVGEEIVEPGSVVTFDPRWAAKLGTNAFGAACTAVVMVVFAVTKFREGAWVVLVLTPALVFLFYRVHWHYRFVARRLTLEGYRPPRLGDRRHRVIVPVSGVHRGTLQALHYARSISDDVTAVHVSIDAEEADKVRRRWDRWGEGTRLVIIESPYRLLVEPLLDYIGDLADLRRPGETISVVVPLFVPENLSANLLHAQTAFWLRNALIGRPGIVITEVPYQIAGESPL